MPDRKANGGKALIGAVVVCVGASRAQVVAISGTWTGANNGMPDVKANGGGAFIDVAASNQCGGK